MLFLISDFSDRLGRPRQHGFRAEPSEYGIQPVAREPETLMEVLICLFFAKYDWIFYFADFIKNEVLLLFSIYNV